MAEQVIVTFDDGSEYSGFASTFKDADGNITYYFRANEDYRFTVDLDNNILSQQYRSLYGGWVDISYLSTVDFIPLAGGTGRMQPLIVTGDVNFTYDGSERVEVTITVAGGGITEERANELFVKKSGDTMTGDLIMSNGKSVAFVSGTDVSGDHIAINNNALYIYDDGVNTVRLTNTRAMFDTDVWIGNSKSSAWIRNSSMENNLGTHYTNTNYALRQQYYHGDVYYSMGANDSGGVLRILDASGNYACYLSGDYSEFGKVTNFKDRINSYSDIWVLNRKSIAFSSDSSTTSLGSYYTTINHNEMYMASNGEPRFNLKNNNLYTFSRYYNGNSDEMINIWAENGGAHMVMKNSGKADILHIQPDSNGVTFNGSNTITLNPSSNLNLYAYGDIWTRYLYNGVYYAQTIRSMVNYLKVDMPTILNSVGYNYNSVNNIVRGAGRANRLNKADIPLSIGAYMVIIMAYIRATFQENGLSARSIFDIMGHTGDAIIDYTARTLDAWYSLNDFKELLEIIGLTTD